MFKTIQTACAVLLSIAATGHARAEVLECVPERMCFDHRPCALVDDPQQQACLDRPTCDALPGEGMLFSIDLPPQGTKAVVAYPGDRFLEANVLSRFTSPYSSDPKEEVTLAILPIGDADAPNKNLIYLELDRTSGRTTAEAVNVDLATGPGRATVTIYSACVAQ